MQVCAVSLPLDTRMCAQRCLELHTRSHTHRVLLGHPGTRWLRSFHTSWTLHSMVLSQHVETIVATINRYVSTTAHSGDAEQDADCDDGVRVDDGSAHRLQRLNLSESRAFAAYLQQIPQAPLGTIVCHDCEAEMTTCMVPMHEHMHKKAAQRQRAVAGDGRLGAKGKALIHASRSRSEESASVRHPRQRSEDVQHSGIASVADF